jgi:RNA polymerase sigma-70 factor (ECF subfamily)
VATSHVVRQRRIRERLVGIEEIETMASTDTFSENEGLDRLSTLIQRLKPLDRQIIISYLEGWDANSTAEVTGLSSANVAMKVHRIKTILKRWFHEGGPDAE